MEITVEAKPRRPFNSPAARWALIPAAAFLTAVFFTASRLRLIDGDEGFYLLAAKSVWHGRVLYRDFFFTQMPLSPYLYGAWLRVAGETWNSGRLLSVVFATSLGCLLYSHVTRVNRSLFAGCCAVFLYMTSIGILAWFPLVKTYSLSTLLLFGAYLALCEVSDRKPLVLGGLLLGLAIDTRLYLVAMLPIFLTFIYCRRTALPRLATSYAYFFAGLIISLAPNMYWIIHDSSNYFFDNIGYHAIRDEAGLIGAFRQKAVMVLDVAGLHASPEGNGLPFGILVMLCGSALALHRRIPGPNAWPAISIASTMIIVCMLPTPTFYQYYCAAVPFLVVGAVTFAWNYARSQGGIAILVVLLLAYVAPLPGDVAHYFGSGVGVSGIANMQNAVNWRLEAVREISREINRQAAPGEPVLSFWPGYLVESTAACVPGMESHVGLTIAPRLSAGNQARYRIRPESAIAASLARHEPRLVVLGNQESMDVDSTAYPGMLERHGYIADYNLGHTYIYMYRP